MQNKIQAVPTNIVTGFLGVGKTTAILHLLDQKPADERWAVLVNEFGEIGVDGSLFQGQHSEESGVFVREVPGGCMCCTAGLPMQIALSQLLSRARPQRLLIEPSGLGHPKEVVQTLNAEHYQSVLNIQKNITLVDARKLRDSRYTDHDTFNQQIDIADIVVGNKQDLYQSVDREQLESYVRERSKTASIVFATHGQIDFTLLEGLSMAARRVSPPGHLHGHSDKADIQEASIPEPGYLKVENQGEGYQSIGWRFSPEKTFNRKKLFAWLSGLLVERLKAVFITDEGVFGYNLTPEALTEIELDDCIESKIEIIAAQIDKSWEANLMDSLTEA